MVVDNIFIFILFYFILAASLDTLDKYKGKQNRNTRSKMSGPEGIAQNGTTRKVKKKIENIESVKRPLCSWILITRTTCPEATRLQRDKNEPGKTRFQL